MTLQGRALPLLAALAAVAVGGAGLSAQGVGSIRGKVVEDNTLKPLSGAQVTVPGTGLGALTDASGAYVISRVPAGAHAVKAEMLGYTDRTKPVTVTAGQAAEADFNLAQQAVALNEIVVTGTPGAVQKKTLGNTVTTINAADVVQKTGNTNVVEVLAARTPGLTLSGGSGTAGTATNIKIRGVTSLAAGNQPVVYVDGVRIASAGLGNFAPNCCSDTRSSQNTDALGGVNPDDIESIEVIKGPAAATLYGADAAAGVIQIITKKGRPGQQKLQWNAKVQAGANTWGVAPEINYTLCDAAKLASPLWTGCAGKPLNTILSQNVMTADPNEIRTGAVRNYALGVRGGGDNYSFYVAGDVDSEQGILLNNFSDRRSIRSNFAFNPMRTLDFSVNFGYSQQHIALPQNDNSALGIMFNSMLYRPGFANPWGNNLQPDTINMYDNQTTANELILGTTVNYRPLDWFRNRLTVGYNSQVSEADLFYPPGRVAARIGPDSTGYVAQQIPRWGNYTVDYAGTMSAHPRSNLSSDFSFGAQYLASRYNYLFADGLGLSSQYTQLVSNAAKTTGAETFSESNTLGFFAQEQVGLNDRLFLTAGARMDNSSVFGSDVKRIFYPKLSASYVVSDEPWFHLKGVDNLRLRAAWGQAGKAPAPYAATRTYTSYPTTLDNGASVSGVLPAAYGNPSLEPERGSEIEAGFDAGFLGGRAGLEFTYYDKHMTNGLVSITVPPSSGFAGSYYENLLNMSNHGIEAAFTASPVQQKNVSWDARLNLSTNYNKLNSFGYSRPPFFVGYYGLTQGVVPGYPVYGFWAHDARRDASGNPVIVNGVAQVDTSARYVGSATPTREIGFSNTITLFKNVSLYGLLDYKGGFYQFDVRDWRRALKGVTAQMATPNADPTYVALVNSYPKINAPWIQAADFLKLRDLAATYTFPRAWTRAFHSDRTSLTLAAHNVGMLWTKYKGLDPEANFNGADDFYRNDAWTLPMQRQVTATLNVSF